ncbi:helix-turn-helix domain-containing protein [Mesorhizobium sp. M7A.F.Ca.CA.001.09.2.1]|uniref:Helix-turn-helix domain-containing protein n=1 Tax=Mesorhizobium ciceri TaxID=39645 RepID=A0AB38TLC8_9HYPH|nr:MULTISPECIES: helix-turn-helix domain-containing protein [Mesorhizobium]AMY03942.1 AraC family transcriptional regulator [Mesorhizobium ciceri biovar biserrulae]MDF3156273.1 helix-turn-helix domain-containing protein [Mesorhizobium sp. XAP10]MDF3218333.1 helix-turn-helix domain-containing protein [Mesorhizobium ciceri]MDF3249103.1 helix-turn-helix domain-containing protein [Mesorhizobium sp. XAP4]RUY62750.1 helix-turn-helix domain-containing protein [Mesorhizobium sp. M7A.F.Ca.CA.001.09.2.1
MVEQIGPLNVAILAVPEATASTIYGMFDLFSSPGRDFLFITSGAAGTPRMRPYVVAGDGSPFRAANGIWMRPDHSLADCPPPDIVCIPDFFVNPGESVAGQYDAEAAWLKRAHDDGAMLASACSGAVLLGEAGLLDNRDATIHWGYVETLTNNYPGVKVKPGQSLVLTGEAHRIVMAGGGSSWEDLALYLIARFVSLKEAMQVAKVYMLQWHDMGQQPFAALMRFRQTDDAVINRCQKWAEGNYRTPSPVAAMTKLSGLSERSFVRRFAKATEMKAIDYIHALRLEQAKQMLETGDLPVEAVASEVGYEDASFFGRLFRRKVGVTPAQYRIRFGALRRALSRD